LLGPRAATPVILSIVGCKLIGAVILSEAGVPRSGTTVESKDPYSHHGLSEAVILSESGVPRCGTTAESKDPYNYLDPSELSS